MKSRTQVIVITVPLLIGIALWLPGLRLRLVAAQSLGLMGSYGFSATTSYGSTNSNPFAVVGVLTFDGAGNLNGSETYVQPDSSPNASTVQTQPVTFSGTYKVNGDGTGAMNIQLNSGIPIAFVITDGGSGLMFVQTGGTNSLLTGTARKQ